MAIHTKGDPKNEEERKKLFGVMQYNYMFASSGHKVDVIVDSMTRKTLNKGDKLAKKGDSGNFFYIVASGRLTVSSKSGKSTLNPGDHFGEVALLYATAYDVTVTASEPCLLWALDRETFRTITRAEKPTGGLSEPAEALRQIPMFDCLTEMERTALGNAMEKVSLDAGTSLEVEGEQGSTLYALRKGTVTVTQSSRSGSKANLKGAASPSSSKELSSRGSTSMYFGVNGLMERAARNSSTVSAAAKTKISCWTLASAAFEGIMKCSINDVWNRNLAARLSGIELFSGCSPAMHARLAACMAPSFFKAGETILAQGSAVTARSKTASCAFYLIERGEVTVHLKHPEVGTVEVERLLRMDTFGIDAVHPKPRKQPYTVQAVGDTMCWGMSAADFVAATGDDAALTSAVDAAVTHMRRRQDVAVSKKQDKRESEVELKDLKKIVILGIGSFGQVWLVKPKNEKGSSKGKPSKTYALKCMQKGLIARYKQKEHVINEKQILAEVQHPFVNKLIRTYNDKHYLYVLLDLVLGGELFSRLKAVRTLADGPARFYGANIALFFECMHKHNVVYRDLKPENMLVDELGYIIVCDFGFAKKITDKTYTLCGTTDYLAPEVILHKGHGAAFDWWTLGIFIYEMITGNTPFQAESGSASATYQNICKQQPYFPSSFSRDAKDLVAGLLSKDPTKRLGIGYNGESDCSTLKKHPWFEGFDWNAMLARELEAPWKPTWKGNTDTSNFDRYDDDLPAPDANYRESTPGWDTKF